MSRQPSWLLWATLPAGLLVVAFGLWLHLVHTGPTSIDQSWLEFVGLDRGSGPYWVAIVLAEVGSGVGVVACTAVLAVVFTLRRRWRSAIFLVTTMLAGIAASEILKAVVTRLRPGDQLYESLGFSYPSGHSMGAAALAMSLAIIACRAHEARMAAQEARKAAAPEVRTSPAQEARTSAAHEAPTTAANEQRRPSTRLGFHWSFILAGIWILAMMWSRTALQVHWLTDTIAGALIGVAVAVLVDEFWTLTARRTRSPRFALWLTR